MMCDVVLDVLLEVADSVENRVYVDAEDVAAAYGVCLLYRRVRGLEAAARFVEGGSVLRHLDPEVRSAVVEKLSDLYSRYGRDVEVAVMELLRRFLRKYVWLRFFAATPLAHPVAVLCLVANPPQVIGVRGITWSGWVYYFFPRRDHRPLLAKLFYGSVRSLVSSSSAIHRQDVEKLINMMFGRDAVLARYLDHYQRLILEQGLERGSCNAFRSLVSWVLDATALVFWFYAVELEGRNIPQLPYILSRDPEKADSMYPPCFFLVNKIACSPLLESLCPRLLDLEWRWIVETWKLQVRKLLKSETRLHWTKIAKTLLERYLDCEGRCRICREKLISSPTSKMTMLSIVYRHFKERHPDKMEEAGLDSH